MSINRRTFLVILMGVLGFTPCASMADPPPVLTLDDLLGPGGSTLVANDKIFADWTLLEVQTTNGGMVDLTGITVTALEDDPLNPGLRFTANVPALGTPFGHDGPATASLRFSFSVATVSGDPLIKDNSLALTDFVFDAGPDATISISETIRDATGNLLGDKSVFAESSDFPNSGDPDHFDSAVFAPQSILFVEKFIDIQGPGDNDGAFLTSFEQRFSQVPAPGAALLAVLGLPAVGWVKRQFS